MAADASITDVCASHVANRRYFYSVKWQQLRKPGFCCSRTCQVITPGRKFTACKSTDVCRRQSNQIHEPILLSSTYSISAVRNAQSALAAMVEYQPMEISASKVHWLVYCWSACNWLTDFSFNRHVNQQSLSLWKVGIQWFSLFYIIANLISLDLNCWLHKSAVWRQLRFGLFFYFCHFWHCTDDWLMHSCSLVLGRWCVIVGRAFWPNKVDYTGETEP